MGRTVAEAARKLTYEDYCTIPEDGKRHEIIDGVEYVSPSPNLRHQLRSGSLSLSLGTHLRSTRQGTLLYAPFDVHLDDHSVVQPDLLVVLTENRARLQDNGCHGPPDLVVEILSPSNPEHDVIRKRRLYEAAGVREYWILDPALARIDVYRLESQSRFGRPVVLFADRGDSLETPLLPRFTATLAGIFEPGDSAFAPIR